MAAYKERLIEVTSRLADNMYDELQSWSEDEGGGAVTIEQLVEEFGEEPTMNAFKFLMDKIAKHR